jgi:hypothetical protein
MFTTVNAGKPANTYLVIPEPFDLSFRVVDVTFKHGSISFYSFNII